MFILSSRFNVDISDCVSTFRDCPLNRLNIVSAQFRVQPLHLQGQSFKDRHHSSSHTRKSVRQHIERCDKTLSNIIFPPHFPPLLGSKRRSLLVQFKFFLTRLHLAGSNAAKVADIGQTAGVQVEPDLILMEARQAEYRLEEAQRECGPEPPARGATDPEAIKWVECTNKNMSLRNSLLKGKKSAQQMEQDLLKSMGHE